MGEYTNLDMVKSLVRAIELLVEENKELRNNIKELKKEASWCIRLTDEERQAFEESLRSK